MLETKELELMDEEEEAKAVEEAEIIVTDYFKNRHRVSFFARVMVRVSSKQSINIEHFWKSLTLVDKKKNR